MAPGKSGKGKATYSAPKAGARIGYISIVPMETIGYSSKTMKLGNGSKGRANSYESKSKVKFEDKKTGSYQRFSTKEKVSTGKTYGKNEYKMSSTVKIGNKCGKSGKGKVTYSAPKAVATIAHISTIPMVTTGYSSKTMKLGNGSKGQAKSYESKSTVNFVDKKTGSYHRFSTKEKVSSGKTRGKNGSGVKNECKTSSTVKIGNKRGYTVFSTEERVCDVTYDKGRSYNSGNNNNYLPYGYGYGCDSDSDC